MAAKSKSRAGDLRLWRNARLTTMADGSAGLGVVEHGAVAARDGRIVYAGPESELPPTLAQGAETVDCEGRWITPGL
ncbi:imidazolonepropionase, partial [Mesorhizobium sp. M7A.F.Ca.US.002.01.1.1]